MSTTACWATNKLEECCWFSGGYGSSYDLSRYWVSLEGLKALVKLDWKDPINDNIKFEQADSCSRLRMLYSAYHIHIPGDNEEKAHKWFEEVFSLAGCYEEEYAAFRKERGASPYFNDDGYDDFFKTKSEFACLKNCRFMSDQVEYSPFNNEYELGRRNRHFNGFWMVEDMEYDTNKQKMDADREEMLLGFSSPINVETIDNDIPAILEEKFDYHAWYSLGGPLPGNEEPSRGEARRRYVTISHEQIIVGGYVPELQRYRRNCSFQAYDDMYENPHLP